MPDVAAKVGGVVASAEEDAEGGFQPSRLIAEKDLKKMDRFIHLALVAATEAVEDSGWVAHTEDDRCATGVMIGSGIGGLETIYNASIQVP